MRQQQIRRRVLMGLAVFIAVALPFWLGPAMLTTAVFVLIAAIGVTGLNVLTGYTGQVSLGHAFFLAAGAYTAVVLAELGLPAIVWLPAAGVVAAVFGGLIGPTALRLTGLYLAIVTMGLIFLGQHVLFNVHALSGGPQGRAFPAFAIGSFDFSTDVLSIGPVLVEHNGLYYYLAATVLLVSTLYARNLARTRPGRAMLAVRERPGAAAVMGVHIAWTKVLSFVISSFLAGISGALYASYIGFAQPGHWSLLLSIQYVAAIVIGGMGSVAGPLLGAIVVFGLPSMLQRMPFMGALSAGEISASHIAAIVYGVLIIAFLVAEPRGLAGIGRRVAARRRGPPPAPEPEIQAITDTDTTTSTPTLALQKGQQ